MYLIPKAKMHPVERWVGLAGLLLAGLAMSLAAGRLDGAGFAGAIVSLAAVVAVAFYPGTDLEYAIGPEGIRAGSLVLPLRDVAGVRVVPLAGTVLYAGLALPGYWCGRAWSRRLGRFRLLGTTGLGRGVLISLKDGRRLVFTPAEPESVVVRLQALLRARPALRVIVGGRPR